VEVTQGAAAVVAAAVAAAEVEMTKSWHFILQWHITAECQARCRHCYMYDEPGYEREMSDPLTTRECVEVIDDFVAMLARLSKEHAINLKPRINFTGGDPLLREDFYALLGYAGTYKIAVGILGNSYLIDATSARKLAAHGVSRYQLSLDGLEETHDALRRPGSFRDTLRALDVLRAAGIHENVMFTLSKRNADDLIPVMRLVAQKEVRRFDFARLAAIGNARADTFETFTPEEYREILLAVHTEMRRLAESGAVTRFGFKDPLWNLLRYELDDYRLDAHCAGDTRKIFDGCRAGHTFLTLLADGTVYACRRFVSPLGNVRSDDLYDLFRHAPLLNRLRNVEYFHKCRVCELRQYCRGCPAVAAGAHAGSCLSPDPQCWIDPGMALRCDRVDDLD